MFKNVTLFCLTAALMVALAAPVSAQTVSDSATQTVTSESDAEREARLAQMAAFIVQLQTLVERLLELYQLAGIEVQTTDRAAAPDHTHTAEESTTRDAIIDENGHVEHEDHELAEEPGGETDDQVGDSGEALEEDKQTDSDDEDEEECDRYVQAGDIIFDVGVRCP